MSLISIAKGLKSSFKNARSYTIAQALDELKLTTSNYEVLGEYNRVYGDIDGKDIKGDEDEFNDLNERTKNAIVDFLGNDEYALMTASSFLHRKISWRFVYKNYHTTIAENKQWVKTKFEEIKLPAGIMFDTIPYGKNQKMRMLNSNKDDEKRPLELVKGEPIDTLISYIPETSKIIDVPLEKKKNEKKKVKPETEDELMPTNLLERIVMNIPNEDADWDQWYKVSQAVFNEGGTLELFQKWSKKSSKHDEFKTAVHWDGLKKSEDGNKLTSRSLWYWSSLNPVEHEAIVMEYCAKDTYQHQKILFEREHFKLKSPPCYVRNYDGNIQYLREGDLHVLYGNKNTTTGYFLTQWFKDEGMRTYERVVFRPKQSVGKDEFNIFTDFPCEAKEGDISVMKEMMESLTGDDPVVMEYVENYFAHLIQKPYEKPGVALLFYSKKQGAGKDTPLDQIGKMLGEEYYTSVNNNEVNDRIFCRFNDHLQKKILVKIEELDFETAKKNENALLTAITCPTQSYEGKGQKPMTIDDYKRFVMTTNKSTPMNVPDGDRRLVLIHSSEKRVGDREYWDATYTKLQDPVHRKAYYHHLLNKDISNFNVRNKIETNFYREVKMSLRPYHAVYFQNWIARNGELYTEEELTASDWLKKMNDNKQFPISPTKFGNDMREYPADALTKKKGRFNNSYVINTEKMHEFLQEKGWWADT